LSRIQKKFQELKDKNEKGLIAYVTAGDPNIQTTLNLVKSFEETGVDLIELGIPFSDPLADGLVNQLAATRALESGTTIAKILDLVKTVRKKSEIPLIIFTYLNPVLQYGFKKFAKDAGKAGIDGILILDLPPEEAGEYKQTMIEFGLDTIFLIAPTSSEKRIKDIAALATGFIYCVSRTGVTGARGDLPVEAPVLVQKIRSVSNLPIAVGFGISTPKQVEYLSKFSDAIVVGSAIVKKIEENAGSKSLLKNVIAFTKQLSQVLHP
jgi:tryptophan synthase alpha chain